MNKKCLYATTLRLALACIFATGVAFSDSLKSALQYSAELESKQSSIVNIKEDTDSIEEALKNKVAKAIKRVEEGGIGLDDMQFTAHEISSLVPPSPRPGLNIQPMPNGTLSPGGNKDIINRGLEGKSNGKKD